MTAQPQPWICPKCQTDNDADFTHCRKCATANPASLKEGENICASCGHVHEHACCPSCNSPEFLQL
jgi:ribosomal protein L40E